MNAEIERLIAEEDAGWVAFSAMLHRIPPERLEEPGVTGEGWSAKDVMFHVGAWLAEASRQLERIREGTYVEPGTSTQVLNDEWFALSRTLDAVTVRVELEASRVMARGSLGSLGAPTPLAVGWFEESGALHYAEHLPSLGRWLGT
ncbi:MAG TPA: maleylpyruvate isomerase N-terminal domain-containing protein [Actinomycetota bacterium]|nr:maleylpyruvate isomerase N-terminal domain-containing protein [Actinomycetota bacterium]